MLDLTIYGLPDDVTARILEAKGRRTDARAVVKRWRSIVEDNFEIKKFPAPQGKVFCVDFETSDTMTKDCWCGHFGGTDANEIGRCVGEVTFLHWVPAYFRSSTIGSRDIVYDLGEQDSCALWRLISQIQNDRIEKDMDAIADDMSPVKKQGHLVVSEGDEIHANGVAKLGKRQVIGRLSVSETNKFLQVLDHRKNQAATRRGRVQTV